jgi:hypothetical protein
MKVTFSKLHSGKWGLRVSVGKGESVSVGDRVEVIRKDGSTDRAVVGRIVWSGDDRDDPNGKVALCEIAATRGVSA